MNPPNKTINLKETTPAPDDPFESYYEIIPIKESGGCDYSQPKKIL